MWNMKAPSEQQHGQVGDQEGQPDTRRASKKSRRGMGVATNHFSSLPIRKLTSRKPTPQSPPPIVLRPIRPGIRKSI